MRCKRHNLLSRGILIMAVVMTVTLLPVSTQEVQAGRKVKSYKITYELNGGKNSRKNVKSLRKGRKLTLRKPVRTGYSFRGWYEKGKKVTKITGNKKHMLTAKWEQKRPFKKDITITASPIDGMFVPEVEDAGSPLSAPKNEKSNKDGSRNIHLL